ncbi:MAG: transcription factor TFIIIB subunit brf1 [Claussenomyces sp. TS43310]|nr:MAG: transcription factor TFIIIB subunit brf1 [Claussenomyces sp. TS43310]
MPRWPKVQQAPRRPNPLTNIKPIRQPPPLARQALQGATKSRRLCPNKQCTNPKIEDGVCVTCGTIIDESNIVAEVQFGENASGGAVVQGSFVSADQGAAKSLGPAFRRAGGSEDREKTLREGKRIMQGFAGEHKLSEAAVNSGMQIFKLAAMNNFIQGRRLVTVAAVCLYTACRKERPCRVMLIDFADSCQVNVFKLGHCFKALHSKLTLTSLGVQPIYPEDLIYRFAAKLEFHGETEKVAEAAIRLSKRMGKDWMIDGRRPSGICGACLILAARMHNFRRTVKEVVYIVKVTTQTLQKRLDEFKVTPSSELTVEEFLENQFLESAHDPPSFYEKTEAFQAQKKNRKRKRPRDEGAEGEKSVESQGSDVPRPDMAETSARPGPQAAPFLSMNNIEDRRDADGFAVPDLPQPSSSRELPIDPALLEDTEDIRALESLVNKHGDVTREMLTSADDSGHSEKGKKEQHVESVVDEAWEEDERILESEITEVVNDPNSIEHARAFATAEQRARVHAMLAFASHPQKDVPMTADIEEGEFADDPEVLSCILSEAEATIKEQIWVNANKDWLRDQQQKEYRKKMEKLGPKKATRKRVRKPKIGEGQTSAASSPAEAAVTALKERAWSKRINYDAIKNMFDGPGSVLGSATTSRATSRAGSTIASSVAGESAAGSVVGENEASSAAGAESDIGNLDDLGPEEDLDDSWKADFAREEEEEEGY